MDIAVLRDGRPALDPADGRVGAAPDDGQSGGDARHGHRRRQPDAHPYSGPGGRCISETAPDFCSLP